MMARIHRVDFRIDHSLPQPFYSRLSEMNCRLPASSLLKQEFIEAFIEAFAN
jgi:hypothetical protein